MVNQSSAADDQEKADLQNTGMPVAQAELLQAVLETENYPWHPAEAAAEAQTDAKIASEQIEAAAQVLEISDEEVAAGWQGLSQQLNQIWAQADAAETTDVLAQLQAQLRAKFAGRLPAAMLAHISEQAQQVVRSGEPMVAQMIACVRAELSHIVIADLQVMARPMAGAMRGSSADEFVAVTAKSVRQAEWDALSPIEQAKLGLAAARYAISQVED